MVPREVFWISSTGMIKWGQNSKPKQIPGSKFNPQKIPCLIT